ncbi:MAG: hypothetical protein U0271_34645 [Polyangiaceae bacterium]
MNAGPWLWSPRRDLAVFGGAAVLALIVAALGPSIAPTGDLPPWGFLVFVVACDVAHVYSTLFRTYMDGEELVRRPALYFGVPVACFVAGVALYAVGSDVFWRVLAYVALVHFVRQQVGWTAIYRARAGRRDRLERWVDDTAVYAATLYPVLEWHTRLPREFAWFVQGDFLDLATLSPILPVARVIWGLSLTLYVVYGARVARATRVLSLGKHVVVAGTAATWYFGIVATNSDFAFTVSNVVVHGLPYMALLYAYGRERARESPGILSARLLRGGLAAFAGLLLVIAFVEELIWDQLVWQSHPSLFGAALLSEETIARLAKFIVPLLAVPQATHYVLDAVLWRRGDTGAAQGRAMGFAGAHRDRAATTA